MYGNAYYNLFTVWVILLHLWSFKVFKYYELEYKIIEIVLTSCFIPSALIKSVSKHSPRSKTLPNCTCLVSNNIKELKNNIRVLHTAYFALPYELIIPYTNANARIELNLPTFSVITSFTSSIFSKISFVLSPTSFLWIEL